MPHTHKKLDWLTGTEGLKAVYHVGCHDVCIGMPSRLDVRRARKWDKPCGRKIHDLVLLISAYIMFSFLFRYPKAVRRFITVKRTMAPFTISVLYSFVLLITTVEADAICYYPNGTAAGFDIHDLQPCNNAPAIHSMCCNLNNTQTPDRCNSDGLCIPPKNEKLWRHSCTDHTWKDPACLDLCTSGRSKKYPKFLVFVRLIHWSCY